MRTTPLLLAAMLLSLAACKATVTPGEPGDGSGPDTHITTDTTGDTGDTSGTNPPDTTTPDTTAPDTEPDVVTCLPGSIRSRISEVIIPSTDHVNDTVIAAPAENGSTVLAWETSNGVIGRHVDANGESLLSVDITVSNGTPLGVGATSAYYALLQSVPNLADPNQPNQLVLRLLERQTFAFKEVVLTGPGSPDGVLFDDFAPTAKLVATPTAFAVYFSARSADRQQQGDAIRFFSADGTLIQGGWTFQCNTALDLRLAYDGTTTSPICLSGCGDAGVQMANPTTPLFGDSAGNCAGAIQTDLGSVVTTSDGLWVNFSTLEGRSFYDVGLVRYTEPAAAGELGVVDEPVWLTSTRFDSENARLAAYEDGLLAGWTEEGVSNLVRLTSTGDFVGTPEPVGLFFETDFYNYDSGDVGWVFDTTGEIHVVRVTSCQ